MATGVVQYRGVIDWSGAPGGPSINGGTGEPGINGAASTDSSPGKDGGPGRPGMNGLPGQPGANGRDIYAVLEQASDDQHVRVKLANQTTDYALPLLLRSDGGVGSSGGNGGAGGVGGVGGDGCKYIAHEERFKYKWILVGGYGISAGEKDGSKSGRKRAPSSSSAAANGSQAQVGVQASGDGTTADKVNAGPATAVPAMPAGIPSASSKKKKTTYLEHMAWDNTLWRAALTEDGNSFIIVRNGQTSIANGLHILDWHGDPWVISVENRNSFIYAPPDPAAMPARPIFRTGALQYLDWFGTPCEVKIKSESISAVVKLSNGGNGGQGGPGGAASPGSAGGDGGAITIATTNPALLLNVFAESLGGNGGFPGIPGPGGKGGAGGRGQVPGMIGPDGVVGADSFPGPTGKRGFIQYLRLDNAGGIIQRGTKKPELKLVAMETKCSSGSAVLETSEPAVITLRFQNVGDISCPPHVNVAISNAVNMSCPNGFVIEEWLDPGVEYTVKLFIVLGPAAGNATFDLTCKAFGGLLYTASHELKDVQHPVEICTILNTPHVLSGQQFELGAIIQNHSGIATGSMHKRPIRAEIVLEKGLVFKEPLSPNAVFSHENMTCMVDVEDLLESPERVLHNVCFSPDSIPFSSRNWSFRLFWKDLMVGEVKGKVKLIPGYDADMAADADALIITHPGFTPTAYNRLMTMFSEHKLRAVTWDYYYYKGIRVDNPFRAKLILFCLRDGADVELLSTDFIKHHFFNEEGADQDSSLLILSPDANETISLLNRRLVEVGHEATDEETTRKFFSKPDSKDFHELVHDIEKQYFPTFPDYYVWSTSKEAAVKVQSGVRSKWKLGEVKIMHAALSYFHRLYVMPCDFATNDVLTNKQLDELSVALRHSLTTSHKIYLIETDQRPGSAAITEAALYFDLKTEFFFLPRPLTFLKQVTDLLFQFTYRYATERIVEAVLRCLYRLRAATYWKSFGFSDFKPKFTTLETILKRLKDTLSSFAYELETTGNKRRLDFSALDSKAQSGAKSSSRVKWRKQTLPLRLRDIPEKEEMKGAPPPDTDASPHPNYAPPSFRDSSGEEYGRLTHGEPMASSSGNGIRHDASSSIDESTPIAPLAFVPGSIPPSSGASSSSSNAPIEPHAVSSQPPPIPPHPHNLHVPHHAATAPIQHSHSAQHPPVPHHPTAGHLAHPDPSHQEHAPLPTPLPTETHTVISSAESDPLPVLPPPIEQQTSSPSGESHHEPSSPPAGEGHSNP